MSNIISCTVSQVSKAEEILGRLQSEGFSSDRVSVLFPEKEETKKWVQEKHTKAPEGAVAGASTGGLIGGIVGWLIGIGSLAIPGIGPFIAAGPIMAALSGTAIGAAVGGLAGTLVGLGIPEFEAKLYEKKLKEGHILVSVHANNAEERAKAEKILRDAGASDISKASETTIPVQNAVG